MFLTGLVDLCVIRSYLSCNQLNIEIQTCKFKTTMKRSRIFQMSALFLICSFLLISTESFAQKNVDFSGKWTLNEDKSDLGEGRFFSASKLAITQDGKAVTLERTRAGRDGEERTTSETITLDGKENVTETENRKTNSVATWSEDKSALTIKSTIEFSRQGETMEMIRTEVLTVGENGKVLLIQSDTSSSRGDRSVSLVYDKE